jgi:outer membrane protein
VAVKNACYYRLMPRLGRIITIAAAVASAALHSSAALAAGQLTLGEAIARALAVAPSLESAAAQSDLSGARVAEARAPLLPSVIAQGEYFQAPGYSPTITNTGLTRAQLMLDYLAFDGGRRAALLRASHYASQAAQLGVAAARAQIAFDTTVAYYDLLRERQSDAAMRASVARLTKYVRIIRALERSGRAIANDVLTIRTTRDSASLALAANDEAAGRASITLGSMIGDFGDTDLQPADVSGLPPPPTGDMEQNPAFKAAQRQVEAAELAVRAAREERVPTLSIALTAGWEGINPPHTFNHNLGASYDGLVSVPIFQGGLIRSHVDAAMAAQHAAQAQQRLVELSLKRDLADARTRYSGALAQLAILRRSAATANDAFALDWTRFLGGGTVTLLEVIAAYQQAQNFRVARFDQEFNARQASAQAQLLIGQAR